MHDAIRKDGHPVRYAERDPIAVAEATDDEGINSELIYERAQVEAQLEEHHPLGHHDTPQIARIFIDARFINGEFATTSRCYSRGVYSPGVAKVSWLSGGHYEIEILAGVPASTRFRIADLSIVRGLNALALGAPMAPVFVRLISVLSSSAFRVQRYEGQPGSISLADGDFQILVYAEAVP